MHKPVIAALIAGTVGFGGFVVSAGFAEVATAATVHHPAPGSTKPHKGTKPGKVVPGAKGQNGSKPGKAAKAGAATGNSMKTTKVVAKPKPKGKGGKATEGTKGMRKG
jgi:hypothetical protein